MRPAPIALALAAACFAQDLEREVRALRPADTAAQRSRVLDEIQERARLALESIRHARTPDEAARVRAAVRPQLEEALGFRRLPWPPDLRPRAAGAVQGSGYRIEKLVYSTLPGVDVAAHLYLPEPLSAPAPAILFYSGHWWPDSKSRPDFQAFCINMARLGFVVLAWDPFGQGERGVSHRDHRRTEALLAGVSQQGIAVHETRCALEYLLGRKEVDPQRIGMTGASGGGYNTWVTAAIDDRIAVAVPVVGSSEFYEQLASCRSHDWYKANEHCHFVPGLIRFANNHEFIAMTAPRPLLIVSAHKDESFPVAGVREVYRYGRELYGALKHGERIGYFEDSTAGHGYQQEKREAAYGWFLKWLMGRGDGSPYPEPPTETLAFDAVELRCFPPGENRMAGPGIVAAVQGIALAGKPRPWPRLDAELCEVKFAEAPVQRVDFCGAPGFLIAPSVPPVGVLVAIDDRGKEALAADPAVLDALSAGWTVAGIDPRGIGERATPAGWVGAVSLLLDDPYVRRQAQDIAAVLRLFSGRTRAVYARGSNASLAAAFAIADTPPERYVLRDGFLSFRQWLVRPDSEPELPLYYFPFRALEREDIPAMLARSRGLLVNPVMLGSPAVPARIVQSQTPEAEIREFLRQ
jgi:dienelactone hydrolase